MKLRRSRWLALCMASAPALAMAASNILVDQVGYDTHAPKQAMLRTDTPQTAFSVVDADSGKTVWQGSAGTSDAIEHWPGRYAVADFSALDKPGRYYLAVNGERSWIFDVQDNVLERHTLSDVIYYFKGQRASGLLDKADRTLAYPDGRAGTLDLRGGWYDATGDYGIHLSHQNPTRYFNTQQLPLVAWSLLRTWQALDARHDRNFHEYQRRLLDEGLFGADFLVRDKRPDGSFWQSIDGSGAGKLPQDRHVGDPNWRTQIKQKPGDTTEYIQQPARGPHAYEASFRAGGGMAIAALALASRMDAEGDFSRKDYLRAAEDAYRFLDAHNGELTNDGKDNIIDDYCALLAAVELYRATQDASWRKAADGRADKLMARLVDHGGYHDYWRADDGVRPFFHPSDAGLPVVALVEYTSIADDSRQARIRDVLRRSLAFELQATADTANPFGLARQLVRDRQGKLRVAFFFPHDSEAAPWWQGENARLASLAAAARMAAPLFQDDEAFQHQLQAYAWNQLHWILGRNPFDTSMLMASGHNNAPYMFFDSYQYTNAPGAIINGITSGLDDEKGIAFDLGYAQTGKDDDWRWTEQWLPHDAWYLLAVSLPRP
ncbi:glycoside hydrolase family 9 protein [Dyella sp.]|uniref:glycoside hydrolase family 9 protein n=1 Tax=Dyella sp. TaxID=1869338 RepID=UPI002ED4548E